MEKITLVATCLFGLEKMLGEEIDALGYKRTETMDGRVSFEGDALAIARANINLRFAERVFIKLGEFTALSFEELFQGTRALPFHEFIGKLDAFPVKGHSIKSKLFSIPDCQSIIKKAVVERLKLRYRIPWFEETGALYQIQFSIMKNVVSLLIDTSGYGLHKRGYRPAANAAPLKETLAASLCNISRLRPYHTLYDPMCGSGTILVEGALMARNIAPGLKRHFTAEKWSQVPAAVWRDERDRAKAAEKPDEPFEAFGSDIDENALKIAKENALRAGVADCIHLTKKDLRDFAPERERGTLICNPPYGERLLDSENARGLYTDMGKLFVPKKGWSYTIITADDEFERCFGRKADKRRKLYNGMIKCQVYMYFK